MPDSTITKTTSTSSQEQTRNVFPRFISISYIAIMLVQQIYSSHDSNAYKIYMMLCAVLYLHYMKYLPEVYQELLREMQEN